MAEARVNDIIGKLYRNTNLIHFTITEFNYVRKDNFKLTIPYGTFVCVEGELFIFIDLKWEHLCYCGCGGNCVGK